MAHEHEPATAAASDTHVTEPQMVPSFTAAAAPLSDYDAAVAAGTKRTLKTTNRDGEQLSEKKLRRLEKNRLSARECRRRKREAAESLEEKISVLEGENLRLRLQLQIGEEAEDSMAQEQERLTEHIEELLKSGASETEINGTIEEFKEKFADYGRDRRSAMEFHLRNIERLLMPTQTTSVAMRALQGGNLISSPMKESAIGRGNHVTTTSPPTTPPAPTTPPPPTAPAPTTPPTPPPTTTPTTPPTTTASVLPLSTAGTSAMSALEPKAMFQVLVNHLEVTPKQAAALKDSRFIAQELDQTLSQSLDVLNELRTRLIQCGEQLDTEFHNVRAILTPTQAGKFLVWVANNGACMHMLNELWERNDTEATISATESDE